MEEEEEKLQQGAKKAGKFAGKQVGKLIGKVMKKIGTAIVGVIVQFLPYILIAVLITSFVAAIIKFVTVNDGSYVAGSEQNVPNVVNEVLKDIGAGSIGYDIDLDQKVEEIITKLNKDSNQLYAYISEEKQKEYLKTFIKADFITQNFKIGTADPKTSDKLNGSIIVQRSDSDGKVSTLQFIDYETFNKYVTESNSEVFKYFSTNEDGQLVIAQSYNHTKTLDTNLPGEESVNVQEYTISEMALDYKSALSSYAMPFNLLWALLVKSTEEDFVYELAKLALDTEITITAYDNYMRTEEKEESTFAMSGRKVLRIRQFLKHSGTITTMEREQNFETGDTTYHRKLTEITETRNVTVNVTSANTWIANYKNEYTYEQFPETNTSNEIEKGNGALQSIDREMTKAELAEDSFAKQVLNDLEHEKVDGVVYTILGGRITAEIKENTRSGSIKSYGNTYKEGTPQIDEKTDINAKEPNFCTILKKYPRAEGKIMSAVDWLFEMMANNTENVTNMIDLVKYLLYKATGEDLGVTELNESWLKPSTFTAINSSGSQQLIEYIHMLEGGYSPKMNADGTKYIVVSDGYGNAAVGWGVDIFNSGYADKFIQAGYSTEVGAEIDKDFVDAIEAEIISNIAQEVNNRTSGLNLKGYQKNALISRAYNCGVNGALGLRNGLTFVEAYQKYWNEATDDYYERQSNVANYSHDLYTEYMIDPRTSNGIYSDGLAKRRKSEWTLFQTGYYDVLNQRHSEGSATIIEAAHKIHKHMEDYKYTYSLTTLPGTANIAWNMRTSCCATYVDWVLAEAGYKKADESLIHGACTLFRVYQEKGFMVIENYSDLQPGDIVFMTVEDNSTITYNGRTLKVGHVQIYAGDGTWYNAGSTERIQQKSPYKSNPSSMFAIALRAN